MSAGRTARRRAAWRWARRAAVVIAAVAVTLVISLAVAGSLGLVVVADCLAALALVIALARTPGGVRERLALRPGAAWAVVTRGWRGAGRLPPGAARPGDFPAYAKISSDLSWAPVSQWHYDHGVRPLLIRLLESALAERHRVDLTADPEPARRLVGDEVWPLIDPSRPPSFDSKAPGPGLRTLTRIVDRLEQL